MGQEGKEKKAGLMGKMTLRAKIIFLVDIALVLSVIIAIVSNRNAYQKRISEMISEDMKAIAIGYGQSVETAIEVGGGQQLSSEILEGAVGNAFIPNDADGYIYVVDENGTMLYHPTAEKIGQPVENDAVKTLVAEMSKGTYRDPGVIEYVFKGEQKYAGFYITNEAGIHDIVVVSANLVRIRQNAAAIPGLVIVVAIIFVLLVSVISYICIGWIIKPIKHLGVSMDRIADLDFTEDEYLKKYVGWQNETGVLARSTIAMSERIDRITLDIRDSVERITSGSEKIKEAVEEISAASTENSNTVVDLSAMMEETTATTDTIAANMDNMVQKSSHVAELAKAGIDLSAEIYDRAADGIRQAESSKAKTTRVLADIKTNTEKAINDARAINRINELTETIKGISEQTNLLSLNASIEAARAGVAGRGFAVVADEIGKLAGESAATVEQIEDIIMAIKGAVDGMRDCLTEVLDFTEKSTEENMQLIESVSNRYNDDTAQFEKSLSEMQTAMTQLDAIITEVDRSVEGINTTVAQSANGIADVAGKTDNVVDKTNTVSDLVRENVDQSENLRNLIGEFTL